MQQTNKLGYGMNTYERYGNRRWTRLAACIAAMALVAALPHATLAGPVEDAAKLLAAKQYDKVDDALGKALSGPRPAPQALRVSLDAAEASGRLITAQHRVTALLKAVVDKEPDLLHRAALIAERAGEKRLSLSRHLAYVQTQGADGPKLRYALSYLCTHGKFPAQFKQYVKLRGADTDTWRIGLALLDRTIEDGEINATLDVAATLLASFPDSDHVYQVHLRLRQAADRNHFGRERRTAWVAPLKVICKTVPSNYDSFQHIFYNATRTMSPAETVEMALTHQAATDKPLPQSVSQHLIRVRDIADEGRKLAAAKAILALEPLYRQTANTADYDWYLRVLRDANAAFRVKGAEVIALPQITLILDGLVARATRTPELRHRIHELALTYTTADSPEQLALMRKHAALLPTAEIARITGPLADAKADPAKRKQQIDAARSAIAKALAGRSHKDTVDIGTALLGWYKLTDDREALIEAAAGYMSLYPDRFHHQHYGSNVMGAACLTVDDKVALLREQIIQAGPSAAMKQIIKSIQKLAKTEPKYKALIELHGLNRPGASPAMAWAASMPNYSHAHRDKVLAGFTEFCEAWSKDLPGGWDVCRSAEDATVMNVCERYYSATDHRTRPAVALQWLSRSRLGDRYPELIAAAGQRGLAKVLPRIAKQLTDGDELSHRVWEALARAGAYGDRKDATNHMAPYYARMGTDNALLYLAVRVGYKRDRRYAPWSGRRELFIKAMDEFAASKSFAPTDTAALAYIIDILSEYAGATTPVPSRLTRTLAETYAKLTSGKVPLTVTTDLARQATRSGNFAGATGQFDRVLSQVAGLPAEQQTAELEGVCALLGAASERGRTEAGPYTRVAERLAALYPKLTDDHWLASGVDGRILTEMSHLAIGGAGRRSDKSYSLDGRLFAVADRIMPLLAEKLAAGAPMVNSRDWHTPLRILHGRLDAAVKQGDWNNLPIVMDSYARTLPKARTDWDTYFINDITALLKMMADNGAHEAVFVFLRRLETNKVAEASRKTFAMHRARAASHIPGLLAVAQNDPTYNLHLAAQALSVGDDLRAWTLTRGKLPMLAESWEALDSQYVAWCIEQMRRAKLPTEALNLAFTVLLKEEQLESEIAARVLLAKGDLYRDKQNYQVARIEYQALRDNPQYRKTAAGVKARYHLVDLLIVTGQYDTATGLLERMIDSGDLTIQAEGYYLKAKLAYQQDDFEGASENLVKVRARVNDHMEAAFLEGRLKLKLPGGLINPEVEVGSAMLRTVAVPGKELVLKLQDALLAVAGDSKTVPVIVRTSQGGDVEKVDLVSISGARNLFRGAIQTSLGKPTAGNRVLELNGADRVSYQLDPAFQRAKRISYPPKFLEVKAPGTLSASAGKILTPEEAERRRLEAHLAAARMTVTEQAAWARASQRIVRPGSPVYVQVVDPDRDMTAGIDTVSIAATTSTGDVVASVELAETGPYTGVFQGTVPTNIPLPKATASDSFEGKSPSWMINSTVSKTWSSLADAQSGKWVAVDMMKAHAMKTLSVELPDPSRIKAIRLEGRLEDKDYRQLAAWPIVGVQHGLRAELFADAGLTKRRPERTDLALLAALGDGNVAVRWTGMLAPPATGAAKLTLTTNGGVRLWAAGKKLVDAWAVPGKTTTHAADVVFAAATELPVRIEYLPAAKTPALQLTWSPPGGKALPVPTAAMFPGGPAARRDNIVLEYTPVPDGNLATAPHAIDRYFERYGAAKTSYQPSVTAALQGNWHVGRMQGTFHIDKGRAIEFRFSEDSDLKGNNWAQLLIDGKTVIGPPSATRRRKQRNAPPATPGRIYLPLGIHKLAVYLRGHRNSRVALEYRDDEGRFVPVPAKWFSVHHTPALAKALSPVGVIRFENGRVAAELTEPTRLRAVQWVFEKFDGNDIAVKQINIADAAGKSILPVSRDFTSATTNDVLEIAPGDQVTVTYIDERRPSGGTPDRTAKLGTGYVNGSIVIANEVLVDVGSDWRRSYHPARRCGPGDRLAIIVNDADLDTTAKRDVVDVTVRTASGKTVTLKALETAGLARASGGPISNEHAGTFLALLQLSREDVKGTVKAVEVSPGDNVTVSYTDRENSSPGIITERAYTVSEGGDGLGGFQVQRFATQFQPDTSPAAEIRLGMLRRLTDDPDLVIHSRIVVPAPPREGDGPDAVPVTSVRAPLAFSLRYPAMAKHAASELIIQATSDSDVAAAKAEGREPTVLEVPIGCGGGLDEGIFHGSFDLQIGQPGDPVGMIVGEDPIQQLRRFERSGHGREIPPTLVVTATDTVHLKYIDPATKKAATADVKLFSDGRIEIMEGTFRARRGSIQMGERFFLRVDDPDRDATAERDTVTVKVAGSGGDAITLTLNETMPHSGQFTAAFTPAFLGEKDSLGYKPAYDPADEVLTVYFGDEVKFEYVDPTAVAVATPVTLLTTGTIRKGANAEVELFTKRFRDPEMAVKTSFLIAEALFETAKHHRKMKNVEAANAAIRRGREVLQAAVRDYPDTKLVVQSEFLLANLAQELGNFNEAISRYTMVIRHDARSDYAARSQYKTAQCLYSLGRIDQACDEYVKVIYVYPNNELKATAAIRLGTHYYQTKQYDVAARVFYNFAKANTGHDLAAKSMFLAGQSRMAEEKFEEAAAILVDVIETFPDNKPVRAEAMYWCGESYYKAEKLAEAFRIWQRLVWAYPELEKAKMARGRLIEKKMLEIGAREGLIKRAW